MATKLIVDAVMDAALDKLATATRQTVCSADPSGTTVAAINAVRLAEKTGLTAGAFTKAAGTASPTGRKLTIQANAGLTVTVSGTATCVCLDDGTNLLHRTTCASQALTSPGTVDVPSYVVDDIAGAS